MGVVFTAMTNSTEARCQGLRLSQTLRKNYWNWGGVGINLQSILMPVSICNMYQRCRIYQSGFILRPRECAGLTVEGQVAEQSSEEIHDEHGQERHISHTLHPFPRTTVGGKKKKKKIRPDEIMLKLYPCISVHRLTGL